MMEWIEAEPIPDVCRDCKEEDCYHCDTAGERWQLSHEDELRVRRRQLVRAIERLQRTIDFIDAELLPFTNQQRAALHERSEMTYDMFWQCLQVCLDNDNMTLYRRIWNAYPNHAKAIKGNMEIPHG